MGLLNPLLLALGLAAAVPLLLHLLQRHQGPRVVFPALRYLRRAERESARRIRVRQILLMLLRITAVLLIAFAAARPFVQAGAGEHAPTAAVIILDNSLSTGLVDGDERVLDRLKARALEMLGSATPEDRFWLLRAGEPDEPALAGDAETTAMRIRETAPTAVHADLADALLRAQALLAAGAAGRATEIHLLTDLQATSFAAPVAADEDASPVIVYHPGVAAPPNRSVSAIEVGGGLAPLAGERTTVAATIAGDGDEPVNVRLLVDNRLVAAAAAAPGATAVLSMPPQPAGTVTGRVEIDADALHADDVRHFAARVVPPPAVGAAGVPSFVSDALDVLAAAGRVRRTGTTDADVVILGGGQGVELAAARTAVIVLPPEQPVELAAVNRRLAAAGIPWRFDAPVAGEARFAVTGDDPLLRALDGVRLRQSYGLASEGAGAADSVLLRLTDGTAWAVRGERRTGGPYVILGSPLTAEASTLPVGVAMLPLVDRLTGVWALAEPPRTAVAAGAEIRLPDSATAVEGPDGARLPVTGGTTYRLGVEPGVYRVLSDDSVLAAFAVNAPAAASELARLDGRGLEARLPGWTLHVTSDAGGYIRAAFRQRLGHEIWRPLIFALLAVLTVETLIAAAGRSRRAAPSPVAEVQTG